MRSARLRQASHRPRMRPTQQTLPEHSAMRIPHSLRTLVLTLAFGAMAPTVSAAARLYIVQAPTSAAARARVLQVHGALERELPIIHAVAARLDSQQAARLRAIPAVRLFEDRTVRTRATDRKS